MKFIKDFLDKYFSANELEIIKKKDKLIGNLKADLFDKNKEVCRIQGDYHECREYINELEKDKQDLIEKITDLENNEEEPLEKYWNNKRPKYPNFKQKLRNGINIDPRTFLLNYPPGPIFKGKPDQVASSILNHVYTNIKYKGEDKGKEYWKFPFETYTDREGDCEDMSIVIANLLHKCGIPYWRIRINVGMVKGGYHAWVTYLAEKDNAWYVLDAAYYYKECAGLRMKWNEAEKYFNIDWSFNSRYVFKDVKLGR